MIQGSSLSVKKYIFQGQVGVEKTFALQAQSGLLAAAQSRQDSPITNGSVPLVLTHFIIMIIINLFILHTNVQLSGWSVSFYQC